MVGVPYFSLGVVGFLIYRGCKKNEAVREALAKRSSGSTDDARPDSANRG
jgi:hypothetical protein